MNATPEPRNAGPEDFTVTATCAICGRGSLILHPIAVTVNLPEQTIQTLCGHCQEVTKRPARRDLVVALRVAGADYVPQGIDDETKALVLGVDVYGTDPVPRWPEGGAA